MRRLLSKLVLLLLPAFALLPAGQAAAGGPTGTPYHLDGRFVHVGQVDGEIVDVSATALLYFDRADGLHVYDRATGEVNAVPVPSGASHHQGWLAPGKVVFTTFTDVFEWSIGAAEPTDLGSFLNESVSVVGSFLLWTEGGGGGALYRRDLNSRVTVHVADVGYDIASLSPTGAVVYAAATGINRFSDGVTEQINASGQGVVIGLVTDDVNIVYQSWTGYYPGGITSVWLYDGTNNVELAEPIDVGKYETLPRYAVAGGWSAFPRTTQGQEEIYVRSPAGVVSQVSDPGVTGDSGAEVVSVSAAGEVLYASDELSFDNQRLYLGSAGKEPVLIADGVGRWTSRYGWSGRPNIAVDIAGRWTLGVGSWLLEYSDQPLVEVAVSVEGKGTVGIAPYGAVCRASCSFRFVQGAVFWVSAAPDLPGWLPSGVEGCPDLGLSCQINLDGPHSFIAHFYELDTDRPISTSPTVSMLPRTVVPVSVPPSVPVRVSWLSQDPDGNPMSTHLELSTNDGPFVPMPLEKATAQDGSMTLIPDLRYQFRVRASDWSDEATPSAWSVGAPFMITTIGPSYVREGIWHDEYGSRPQWYGGNSWTIDSAASMTFDVTGLEVGVIARTDVNLGTIMVYVDGQLRQTVSTAYAGGSALRIVTSVELNGGAHTVRIVRGSQTPGPIEVHGLAVIDRPK